MVESADLLAVKDGILRILAQCSPSQICRSIVVPVTIQVTNALGSGGTNAIEGNADKIVNLEGDLSSGQPQANMKIAASPHTRPQDCTVGTANIALVRNFICGVLYWTPVHLFSLVKAPKERHESQAILLGGFPGSGAPPSVPPTEADGTR